MKIHLPSRLRKALLACLAALAIPASLPGTLGTASGVAAVWLASSQSAQADVQPQEFGYDWQREDVRDGESKLLNKQNFLDEEKGLYKTNSGILNVTESLKAAGLDLEAGVLDIGSGVTLTVGDLYNSKSVVSGAGELVFGGTGTSAYNDGVLSVEKLTFVGSEHHAYDTPDTARLDGDVRSSVIEVSGSQDTLIVINFTNTEKLTKEGLGTLQVGVADAALPGMNLTLRGGTLDIVGEDVTLSFGNLEWDRGTTLELSGTSRNRLMGDVVLGSGLTLKMGTNAYVPHLTMAGGNINWEDELEVSILRVDTADKDFVLEPGKTLSLVGIDITAFDGNIVPARYHDSQTHGGTLKVAGLYTLSGEVNVSKTDVNAGQLTLNGTNKNKYLGDLSVAAGTGLVVQGTGTVTAGFSSLDPSNGIVSVDGELTLTHADGGSFNGVLSVTERLNFVGTETGGAYEMVSDSAYLGGQVSSPVINVEHLADELTVYNFTGETLKKTGEGTLHVGVADDAPLPGTLALEGGTLGVIGDKVSFLFDSLEWSRGTTLRLEGQSSNELVSNGSTVKLEEGLTLHMGANASIADLTVVGDVRFTWDEKLTVDSLHAENADSTLSLTPWEILILGNGESDYAGNIVPDSLFGGEYGGDLNVAGGKHTFSGKVKVEDMDVASDARLVDDGVFTAARLTGSGAISGKGKLTLTGVNNDGESVSSSYSGTLDIHDLVIERGKQHTLGAVKPEAYTRVDNLTLGTNKDGAERQAQLHVAGTLALEKSLTLYVGDGKHKVEHPYLRADWLELPSDAKVKLTLHNEDVFRNFLTVPAGVGSGRYNPYAPYIDNYYLLSGLDEKNNITLDAFDTSAFDGDEERLLRQCIVDRLNSAYGTIKAYNDYELKLVVRGESLVLVFYQNEPDKWVWKGVDASGVLELASDTWKNDSEYGWSRKSFGLPPTNTPNGQDVYFKGVENGDVVKVGGVVTPNSVTVTDGRYHFIDAGSGDGKIDLSKGEGTGFTVEGGGVVDMQVATDIPVLNLDSRNGFTSKFIVHHPDAIQNDTRINLDGANAVLAFGETDGEIDAKGLDSEALAKNIRLQGTALNIQVGETYREYVKDNKEDVLNGNVAYAVPTEELTIGGDFGAFVDHDVTSGSLLRSNVVEDALARGLTINKTGRLGLVLEWENDPASVAPYLSRVNVKEGSLTLKAHWKDVNLAGEVVVSKGSTLKLQGDAGQTVEISSNLSSPQEAAEMADLLTDMKARVVLGSSGDGAIYRLSGYNRLYDYLLNRENWSFDGTIELVGDGVEDVAVFAHEDATGGEHTTLELKGRALTFDTDLLGTLTGEWSDVTAGTINVVKDTINMVGGYDMTEYATDPNARIALGGGKITGEGTLANAELDFHHVITDDIRDFHGAIVAGYLQGRDRTPDDKVNPGTSVSPNRSSWTLYVAPDVTELDVTLAGTGLIEVGKIQDPNLDSKLTLKGAVGHETLGDTVALKNIGTSDIILTGKNVTEGALLSNGAGGGFVLDGEGATWAGNELGDNVTFTLVEGALTAAEGITKKGEGARLVVDAKGTVNVNGTAAELLDSVAVTATETREGMDPRHGKLEGLVGHKDADGNPTNVFDTSKTGVTLVFDEYCFDNADAAMLAFKGDGGTLKATQDEHEQGKGLVLDFTTDGLVELLRKHSVDKDKDQFGHGNVTDLYIVKDGTLDLSDILGKDGGYGNALRLLTEEGTYGELLVNLGLTLDADKAADGILSLSGTSKDVYLVLDKAEGAEDYGSRADKVTVGDINADRMRDSKAVVVDENTALTVTFGNDSPSGVGLNNLIGLEGSTLNLKDGRSENATYHDRFTVELNNALREDVTDDYGFNGAVEGNDVNKHHASIDGTDGFGAKGMDTTFEGTINADAAVDLRKTGDGKLTIGSGETGKGGIVADGSGLVLTGGSVTLQGDAEGGNKLGSLTFAYDLFTPEEVYVDEEGKDVKVLDDKTDNTGLTLTNGADLTLHDIVEAVTAEDGTTGWGGTITVGNDSVLTLDNAGKRCGTVLKDTHIVSAEGEVGSVVVAPDSKLVLAEAATLEGVNLEVQGNAVTSLEGDKAHIVTAGQLKLSGGTLDIATSEGNTVGGISGNGTLTASDSTALTVTGESAEAFTGTLAGVGTLDVNGGKVTLQNVTTLPGTWDLGVSNAGTLTLNSLVPEATVDPLGLMKFDDINVNGGTLTLSGNAKSNVKGKVHLDGDNTLHVDIVEGETDVALDLDFFGADGKQLTQEDLKRLQDGKHLTLELDGPGSTYFRPQLLGSNAGVWHLMLEIQSNDFFIGSHKNVRSGGNLIIDADNPYSAAYQYVTSPEGQNGDLARVLSVLKQEIDAAGAKVPIHEEKMAAAVAGSAIATLGSASVQDVHRQMQSIGNRASMIGTGEMKVNADPVCKPMHTWVNAETGYHKVNADSWAPGYTLNGWGGTLGIAREFTHRTSGGLALTAMYNDFKSDTADYAKGDLDTTYVSGFLTTHRGPWTHSFLATLGKEDVSLSRIVGYGIGSYRTSGDTDGFVAGAMYEVSYTRTFNKKHAMSLQPLFNVEFRHAKLGAYDEHGSDAALHVDDVKADVVTFGMGSRFHAVLTENAFGRPAMFEARALGKVDVGDNYGKATNRLVHGTLTQEVEASEVGRVGGEIGAGITIPLRSRGGTIFVEASAEFRDRYTNFSTSAGYMYNY